MILPNEYLLMLRKERRPFMLVGPVVVGPMPKPPCPGVTHGEVIYRGELYLCFEPDESVRDRGRRVFEAIPAPPAGMVAE